MPSSEANAATPETSESAEADLVNRCLDGDAAAWETLVRTHGKRVFNMAYKFVARVDEAEDLTQEIFVKLFAALHTYDRRASFETWLTRVSRNLCIDRYRRRRREEERFTADMDPDAIPLDELASRPDATLEQRDDIAMVRRALAELSSTYREPVTLRDIHELSYEEIAQRLHLPEGTVKSRISRGRKELARHLRLLQGQPAGRVDPRKRSRAPLEASHAKD
jgi:RNA polymerase sigma-70 factor (ECF subfamily)